MTDQERLEEQRKLLLTILKCAERVTAINEEMEDKFNVTELMVGTSLCFGTGDHSKCIGRFSTTGNPLVLKELLEDVCRDSVPIREMIFSLYKSINKYLC